MRELVLAVLVALGLALFVWDMPGEGPAPATETGTAPQVTTAPAAGGGKATGEYWDYTLKRKMTKDELPFFLRPYTQYGPDSDPLKRAKEVYRAIYGVKYLLSSPSVSFGYTLSSTHKIGDRTVEIRYPNLYEVNGEIVWDTTSGPLYLAEKHPKFERIYAKYLAGEYTEELYRKARATMAWEEFRKIDDFVWQLFILSVREHNTTYLEYIRQARQKVADKFGIHVKALDTTIPWGDVPITLAQVFNLELYDPEEYIPPVIYFGTISAWGYCIAGPNIPVEGHKPERRIAINPQAVVFDWVIGKRSVVYHELAHTIQSFPLFYYVDMELLNELLTNAVDMFELDFLYHSYLDRMRAVAYRHFAFDADYARDYVIAYRVGGIVEFHRDRYLEMVEKVHQISALMRELVDRVYSLFYEDPLFWITLCDQMKDPAMILDVVAALTFDPACIGASPEETIKWCKEHEAEIQRIGEQTMREMAKKHRERREQLEYPQSILAVAWWDRLPLDIRQTIIETYERGGLDAVVALFLEGGDLR